MINWRLARTIIILPGTAIVFVPAAILWVSRGTGLAAATAAPGGLQFWAAVVLGAAGLALAVWTVRLFMTFGDGTPAPWDAPRNLVVRGPYRHVRNPMITSVLTMIGAEALFFASWPVAGWLLFFLVANAVYFPRFEEKDLEKRFAEDYPVYKANVPRWLPRLKGWDPPRASE